MSDYDRMYFQMSQAPRITPVVKILLLINVIAFAAQVFLPFDMVEWFGLTSRVFSGFRVWQILTHIFLHHEGYLFHIIFNMLMLYWFGRDIEMRLGSRPFLRFYLCAGAFAGLIYSLAEFAIARGNVPAIGASGAIMAVMVLYAIFYPDRRLLFMFLFPMKVRTFVILMIGFDLYIVFQSPETSRVAAFAHLGGAAFGFLYFLMIPRIGRWLARAEHKRVGRSRGEELDANRRLDEILDKVNRMGIQSLNKREKNFLKDVSENIDKLKKR